MNPEFILRSGKYAGKTYQWILENDSSYLVWITDNRPEMLKEIKKKPEVKEVKVVNIKEDSQPFTLKPNDNFYNEPPEELCIPYMLDHAEDYKNQLELFKKHNKKKYRLLKEKHEKISRM